MPGGTDAAIVPIVLTVTSVIAAATDSVRGKVYNWLTLPMIATGIVAGAVLNWPWGPVDALSGSGLALLLFGWMFFIGMMGGGDVKFLMGLGAWGGTRFTLEVALLSVMFGGAMAVVILLIRGRLGFFIGEIQRFFVSLVVRELEIQSPRVDKKLKMPFAVPIAAAAIWAAWDNPLERLGLPLWS